MVAHMPGASYDQAGPMWDAIHDRARCIVNSNNASTELIDSVPPSLALAASRSARR